MKKLIKLLALILTVSINAQTKTFVGTLEDYTCGDDRCSIGMKQADGSFYDENIALEFDANGQLKINPEAKDIVIKDQNILNHKYKGKKATLFCTLKNQIYYVSKVELEGLAPAQQTNDFPNASCRVYENGKLLAIAEGQSLYKINNHGEKWDKAAIQNTNEYCEGTSCAKIVINTDGFISVYPLPNTTNGKIFGKVIGDKIYYCRKTEGFKPIGEYVTYKGDKQKAAIIIVANDWFR